MPAQSHSKPKSRPMSRRSFFVGRPRPRSRASRCSSVACLARSYSAGGVRSVRNSDSIFAPTRDRGRPATFNVRVTGPTRTTTVSPTWTSRPGLASKSFICTELPRQAAVASARVLNTRTLQSHLSNRQSCIICRSEPNPASSVQQTCGQGASAAPVDVSGAPHWGLAGPGVLHGRKSFTTHWRPAFRPLMLRGS
jgi:hypothetical protein